MSAPVTQRVGAGPRQRPQLAAVTAVLASVILLAAMVPLLSVLIGSQEWCIGELGCTEVDGGPTTEQPWLWVFLAGYSAAVVFLGAATVFGLYRPSARLAKSSSLLTALLSLASPAWVVAIPLGALQCWLVWRWFGERPALRTNGLFWTAMALFAVVWLGLMLLGLLA